MKIRWYLLLLLTTILSVTKNSVSSLNFFNFCRGNGLLHNGSRVCECFPGFTGFDCSLRVCPSAKAWVDYPHGDNLAHAEYTECSNMVDC